MSCFPSFLLSTLISRSLSIPLFPPPLFSQTLDSVTLSPRDRDGALKWSNTYMPVRKPRPDPNAAS